MSIIKAIYKKREYIVYRSDDGFIVQNILMKGFAHTHLESREMAIRLIKLSIKRRIPRDLSRYLLISLLRINKDDDYCRKVQETLDNKRKKDIYYNSQKGIRSK